MCKYMKRTFSPYINFIIGQNLFLGLVWIVIAYIYKAFSNPDGGYDFRFNKSVHHPPKLRYSTVSVCRQYELYFVIPYEKLLEVLSSCM